MIGDKERGRSPSNDDLRGFRSTLEEISSLFELHPKDERSTLFTQRRPQEMAITTGEFKSQANRALRGLQLEATNPIPALDLPAVHFQTSNAWSEEFKAAAEKNIDARVREAVNLFSQVVDFNLGRATQVARETSQPVVSKARCDAYHLRWTSCFQQTVEAALYQALNSSAPSANPFQDCLGLYETGACFWECTDAKLAAEYPLIVSQSGIYGPQDCYYLCRLSVNTAGEITANYYPYGYNDETEVRPLWELLQNLSPDQKNLLQPYLVQLNQT